MNDLGWAGWDRFGRDLVALAVDNRDDDFARRYDLGWPDDKVVLAYIKGTDLWMAGLGDRGVLSPHAEVVARDPSAAEATTRSLRSLAGLGRVALEPAPGEATEFEPLVKLARGFLARMEFVQDGRAVVASSGGFGSLAELAASLKEMAESVHVAPVEGSRAREVKAATKAERR